MKTWEALIVVFIASACTLVIEIIAGRMLAPYMGVNLFTWTSIIGVVLAGISLGNYAGGWLADRAASRGLLALQLFASALATLSILPLLTIVTSAGGTWRMELIVKVLAYVTAIFFLPGFVMGTISPVVVKLSLHDLRQTGKTVGLIYAFSTLGSILGTFLTGFYLISAFGTRAIIFGVAGLLALTGLLFGGPRPGQRLPTLTAQAVLLVALVAGTVYAIQQKYHQLPFLRETDYFTINITQRVGSDDKPILALVLDHLIHSFSSPDDPTRLEYGYERVYREVTELKAETHPDMRTLFIGGGGYTYPRFIEAVYPQSTIHVIEIDPAVTEVAYERLGLRHDTRIVTYNEDARLFFNAARYDQPYDLIFGDAFNDLSVPYHLTTAEFAGLVHRALAPDGIYMVNIIDNYQKGEFLRAYMNSLRLHFAHVYLIGLGNAWESQFPSTYIVVGAKQPLDRDALRRVATRGGRQMEGVVMEQAQLDAYLASGRQIILTDDYAPVDQLLAPLFSERGF